MLTTVFISDLHLHPTRDDLLNKFDIFVAWSQKNTTSIYILGDLFHAWAGDDCIEPWIRKIAEKFKFLANYGIKLYFMPGNRDFLLGRQFAAYSSLNLLPDPTVIELGGELVLLAHGDKYCTLDISHQKFRWLTRNRIFTHIFLSLPKSIRTKIVARVRAHSSQDRGQKAANLDVVIPALLQDLMRHQAQNIIHGHTHNPNILYHRHHNITYRHFILSDWDTKPQILCYNALNGFAIVYI